MAKILYVVHRFWPYQGGSEQLFFEMARRTAAQGHQVTVFTTDTWDIQHLEAQGKKRLESLDETTEGIRIRRFRVRHLPRQRQLLRWLARMPLRSFRQLFGYPHILVPGLSATCFTTGERFDLIHAGVFPHTMLVASAYAYCRRHRVPFVCEPLLNLGEFHSAMSNPHFLSSEQLWLLQRADAVVTITDFEKEVLMAKGFAAGKITVASPGVSVEDMSGGQGAVFRQRHGIEIPMVLQVSTQTFDKGSIHTVEALKLLWERGWDVSLVMIGQVLTDFASYLAAQSQSVRKRVVVLDYVSAQEKKDAYAACDLFVMPSRADAFGIVYLEAWVYKKPVLAAAAGGVPRVVRDGHNGLLVPFGDPYMLAEYIAKVLADRALGRRLGENGARDVTARYSWEQCTTSVLEVYRRLLLQDDVSNGRSTG